MLKLDDMYSIFRNCKNSSCFCNNLPPKFIACVIGDDDLQLSISVSNFAFVTSIVISYHFYSLKKCAFRNEYCYWCCFQLGSQFLKKYLHLEYVLPDHQKSFLTLILSEMWNNSTDSPHSFKLNIYAYIIYKNVSSKLFCTSSNVLKEI